MSDGFIPVYPPTTGNGFDAFTETISLSGTQYVLTFNWKSRMKAWYVDIATLAGVALVSGSRVSPDFPPWLLLQIAGMPPGTYAPYGPDPYVENNLGQTVLLTYMTDLGTPPSNPYGLRVVLS